MNRYEFEDLISDYMENELSFSKRKEFENYLNNNPQAKSLVKSIKFYKQKISLLPKLKASETFTDNLLKKIKIKSISSKNIGVKSVFAGFSPANISFLTGLFLAFIVVSYQLFNSQVDRLSKYDNEVAESIPQESINNRDFHKNPIASSGEDSTQTNAKTNSKKELTGQIRLVKD
tara:strand:- start:1324 stop:1848 length:525 start_codon:yes stop_codon:yes gene_type:complete